MVAVVAADADDLGRRHSRQQAGCAEGQRLKAKTKRGGSSMDQVEGQILFGRSGKVNDPGFAVAVFDSAIVNLVIEQKAAILHGVRS
jgi:hypothetical protein